MTHYFIEMKNDGLTENDQATLEALGTIGSGISHENTSIRYSPDGKTALCQMDLEEEPDQSFIDSDVFLVLTKSQASLYAGQNGWESEE